MAYLISENVDVTAVIVAHGEKGNKEQTYLMPTNINPVRN
jgi:hypothetical protein